MLLFQLYNKHVLTTTLWEEEKKEMKKVIIDQGKEIADVKEQLVRWNKMMDHALKLVDQIITYRTTSRVYDFYLKEQFILF